MNNTLVLSSAVIASIITSISSLVVAKSNNAKIEKIEKLKYNNDIQKDRYFDLKKYNSLLRELPSINYSLYDANMELSEERMKVIVSEATKRFHRVKDIYETVNPLIKTEYLRVTNEMFEEESIKASEMTRKIYENELDNDKNSLKELLLTRQECEVNLKNALAIQIKEILNY